MRDPAAFIRGAAGGSPRHMAAEAGVRAPARVAERDSARVADAKSRADERARRQRQLLRPRDGGWVVELEIPA